MMRQTAEKKQKLNFIIFGIVCHSETTKSMTTKNRKQLYKSANF